AYWVFIHTATGLPDLSTATATARQKSTSKRLMPEPADKLPDGATLTSSIPVAIPPKQEGLYREALSILEDRHVPYGVAGAVALPQHTGICRYTKDLDIYSRSEDVAKALGHWRELGFACEISDTVAPHTAHRAE